MEAENMQSLQNALPMYTPDLAPEQTISDLIGEDYQTWEHGRVLIDAGCGTGKTHFVLKDLMPWATNWKKVSASRDPVLDNRKKDRLKPVP